jgi:protein phosphatase
LNADFHAYDLQRDDAILLCTDGLTEMVDDDTIRKTMTGCGPRDAVQKLVKAANQRGGVDNITVVVVRVVGQT